MSLAQIGILIVGAVLLAWLTRKGMRVILLLIASILALFWLQPALPLRFLDFWLPTLIVALSALGWVVTTPAGSRGARENWIAAAITVGLILALDISRYVGLAEILLSYRPPQVTSVLLVLATFVAILLLVSSLKQRQPALLWVAFAVLLVLFVLVKVPALTLFLSRAWRVLMDQSRVTASPLDLRWFGYSYVAFRLLHTIRDRQAGRLPEVSLGEYLVYSLFFPALPAGPIDRLERFIKELRQPLPASVENLGAAAWRLVLGLFKKFALAGFLATFALSAENFAQVQSAGWAWVMLAGYSFLIYFDFSGYTDLAVGLGLLLGIRLPENFKEPYVKPNLTQFWNNWHMTLTQWFRAYFFNPLTRSLRGMSKPPSTPVIILITQIATMVMIGLWHGVTWNFVLWGLWHGLGLFAQNRWFDWTRPLATRLAERPVLQNLSTTLSMFLTFSFVTLGWVWFVLPQPADAFVFFGRLVGLVN